MSERYKAEPPLRHGWGGNKKRRDRILADRRLEEEEKLLFPEKFEEGKSGILDCADLFPPVDE